MIQGLGYSRLAILAGVSEMAARAVMGFCLVPDFSSRCHRSNGCRTQGVYGCLQNHASNRCDRILQSHILGAGYAILAYVVIFLFSNTIALLFVNSTEAEILRDTRQFLLTNAAFYLLHDKCIGWYQK